jgi:hypothetical protein
MVPLDFDILSILSSLNCRAPGLAKKVTMHLSKSTYLVFIVVIAVMTLSVTVFKSGKSSVTGQQKARQTSVPLYDREDRYPVVEADEVEPSDPAKRAKLKKQRLRYDKDAPFRHPGPSHGEVAFLPEWQFDFPALPVKQSDAIVIGGVLTAEAHRSENKGNVFSNFEVKVDEVLKGLNLTPGSVINVQRVGGFVNYPTGKKVLFRLMGNGMPAVGERYAFFLNVLDDDYRILTGYELGEGGVMPLDNSRQFETYRRETETDFVKALRDAISQAVPQE